MGDALRAAGYAGIGIWGWGTSDKYEWPAGDLARIARPLVYCIQDREHLPAE